MRHVLVTNDFPPKVGGIQSYLWEMWRRLRPSDVHVLTTAWPGAEEFDSLQPFTIERLPDRILLPTTRVLDRVRAAVRATAADLVVLDPALPIGGIGPRLGSPYAVVVHGAEISVPGSLPGVSELLARVLRRADLVVAAGSWVQEQALRISGGLKAVVNVPPGVDTTRFLPLDQPARTAARKALGLPEGPMVLSVGRLVPRKGVDVLIDSVASHATLPRSARDVARRSRPEAGISGVSVVVAGAGRWAKRLEDRAKRLDAPILFLGEVEEDLKPALYGCADIFAAPCRSRWGGLEQEGFGIVFLEAAACGIPSVAGRSGGSEEAVVDGETGMVVDRPESPAAVSRSLQVLLSESDRRAVMGRRARQRAELEFDYDVLAARLAASLGTDTRGPGNSAPLGEPQVPSAW